MCPSVERIGLPEAALLSGMLIALSTPSMTGGALAAGEPSGGQGKWGIGDMAAPGSGMRCVTCLGHSASWQRNVPTSAQQQSTHLMPLTIHNNLGVQCPNTNSLLRVRRLQGYT